MGIHEDGEASVNVFIPGETSREPFFDFLWELSFRYSAGSEDMGHALQHWCSQAEDNGDMLADESTTYLQDLGIAIVAFPETYMS